MYVQQVITSLMSVPKRLMFLNVEADLLTEVCRSLHAIATKEYEDIDISISREDCKN